MREAVPNNNNSDQKLKNMGITFDTNSIKLITFFESLTGVNVRDCLIDEKSNTVFFVVEEGQIGLAIGKNGRSVRNAEKIIKKRIKVIEFSKDLSTFVRKVIPHVVDVTIRNKENKTTTVEVRVEKRNKAIVIGRDGKNLKLYRELLQRNFNVAELIIK